MLIQKLRDQTNSLGFKVLVGVIVFVMAVFGFGAFNLFSVGEPSIASVNGVDITVAEVTREAERESRRLAAQLGENFDPAMIDPVRLQASVVERLIGRKLLEQAAADLHMGVSERQVHEIVTSDPSFQVSGKFDENSYRAVLRNNGYSPQQYLVQTRELLTLGQFTEGVSQTSFLTDGELRQASRFLGQTRNLAYLAFSADSFKNKVTVSDDEVALYFEENQREFMTQETLAVRYVELKLAELMQDPSVELTEADLHTAYETDKANFTSGERRASRHILLKTGESRTDEQAIEQLESFRSAIADGADMAQFAREHSEDPGSATNGGFMEAVGKGVFDAEYENALWAMQNPGELSKPVKSAYGYHLIRLESIAADSYPSFEQQRVEIEQRLRLERAQLLMAERVRDLDNLAFENPSSLDPIAKTYGLTILEAQGITEMQGPGPFTDTKVRAALFTEDVVEKNYNTPAIALADQSVVVARVVDRKVPQRRELADVSTGIRTQLEHEQTIRLAREAFDEALLRVNAGESVLDVAQTYGMNWQTYERVKRNDGSIPGPVIAAAFELAPPEAGEKRVTQASLADGSSAIVTLTLVNAGVYSALTDAELRAMRDFLENYNSQLDLTGWFTTLERKARIKRG